ncbi:phosphoglycolate phosphatase [Azospirillum sp. CT11-132]|uniref:phosphoglycolate phosphatase n=1 Tax=unclassified Azospirillum TaxID=2630922 RepID=UPI000D617308|nr:MULTISPECIES: phosphoglycolate phosphatase [unclassified Azospirillum]PWC62613.1 phosphoglycolate phosphatase [Azospirillum sp. TSH7]PWC65490.1 phosphoglycolate phosphatase [Azospirillum sp. TSH20]
MGKPAPVIFDLDGTLIDSAPHLGHALNRLLAERGRPAVTGEMLRSFIGDGPRPLVERGFAATGRALPAAEVGPAFARFLDLYAALPADPGSIYPGVPQTLARLADAGHSIGLCTNKPQAIARSLLAELGLLPFFGAIVGGDSLPQRKPAPEPLLAVLAALNGPTTGAPTSAAVMVGDGPNDVAAARAAGVASILVSYGYARGNPADLPADRLIHRFTDLPDALEAVRRNLPDNPSDIPIRSLPNMI